MKPYDDIKSGDDGIISPPEDEEDEEREYYEDEEYDDWWDPAFEIDDPDFWESWDPDPYRYGPDSYGQKTGCC